MDKSIFSFFFPFCLSIFSHLFCFLFFSVLKFCFLIFHVISFFLLFFSSLKNIRISYRGGHKGKVQAKSERHEARRAIHVGKYTHTHTITQSHIWIHTNTEIDTLYNYRRKFRSQTSDNMDRWKAEQGRGREKRKIRRKKSRRERVRRKKMQMREKVGKSRSTVFFQWFGAPEGRKVGSLKRRVRRAGQMRDQKLHAVVARSTLASQNVQNTPGADHFWQLRCRKSARRCGTKHGSKWKCVARSTFPSENAQNTIPGPLLEVPMWRKCTPLWREAHVEVKMYKTPHVRGTFGGSDVVSRGRHKGLCTLSRMSKTWGFCVIFNYNHHYTTLHSNTLHYNYNYTFTIFHYTTLHYTTLHSITLHYITLHSTTLHYLPLHFTTLHYTTLHNATTTTTQLHSTTLHHTPLH